MGSLPESNEPIQDPVTQFFTDLRAIPPRKAQLPLSDSIRQLVAACLIFLVVAGAASVAVAAAIASFQVLDFRGSVPAIILNTLLLLLWLIALICLLKPVVFESRQQGQIPLEPNLEPELARTIALCADVVQTRAPATLLTTSAETSVVAKSAQELRLGLPLLLSLNTQQAVAMLLSALVELDLTRRSPIWPAMSRLLAWLQSAAHGRDSLDCWLANTKLSLAFTPLRCGTWLVRKLLTVLSCVCHGVACLGKTSVRQQARAMAQYLAGSKTIDAIGAIRKQIQSELQAHSPHQHELFCSQVAKVPDKQPDQIRPYVNFPLVALLRNLAQLDLALTQDARRHIPAPQDAVVRETIESVARAAEHYEDQSRTQACLWHYFGRPQAAPYAPVWPRAELYPPACSDAPRLEWTRRCRTMVSTRKALDDEIGTSEATFLERLKSDDPTAHALLVAWHSSARQRIVWALLCLLETPTLLNSKSILAEADALRALLARLAAPMQMRRRLIDGLAQLRALPAGKAAKRERQRTASSIMRLLRQAYENLHEIPYPYDDRDCKTVGTYCFPSPPDPDSLADLPQQSSLFRERITDLYLRLGGRFVELGLHVESELALSPVEETIPQGGLELDV